MRIVIIGTGNVAIILGKVCMAAGHEIIQVYGRDCVREKQVGNMLGCSFTASLSGIDQTANIYILAVTDTAIPELSATLHLGKKLVVHTAGSVSKDILKSVSANYGVLYPLQSLRRETTVLPEIPFLVDGNTPDYLELIYGFARSLSENVQIATDQQRLKLHIAAVIVSNFTNHLYALAEDYCRTEGVDFGMLLPLITAIAQRVREFSPHEVQTGPAVRHDKWTVEKHLAILHGHPTLQELYALFTKNIENMYS